MTSPSTSRRPAASGRRPLAGPAALGSAGPLVVCLLLTAGCAAAPADGATTAGTRPAADSPASGHTQHTGTVTVAAAAASPSAPATTAADQDPVVALRSDLQRLLGGHVLLANEVVRGVLLGQDELVQASSASVQSNTDDLTELVTSLAGAPAGEQFRTAWDRHVEVLGQYAKALQEQDKAGQSAARTAYGTAEQELATALSAVVGGKIPQADLTAAATAHGKHLLGQADAYAAKDYQRAYSLQREAFGHMIVMGDVLARGIAADRGLPTTELDTPRRDLHSALSRLLAEHMGLMVQALRSAHDDAADFAAAGKALNGNTADLGAAIGTLYGPEANKQFLALWATHIEGLMQYARGTDDPAAQSEGRAAQEQYAPALARFLAGAVEQRVPAIELAAELTVHDDHLLAMVDAYAEGNHEESQQQADAGYAHMIELGSTLAVAIGETQAAALPQGGAATGGGGTAGPAGQQQ